MHSPVSLLRTANSSLTDSIYKRVFECFHLQCPFYYLIYFNIFKSIYYLIYYNISISIYYPIYYNIYVYIYLSLFPYNFITFSLPFFSTSFAFCCQLFCTACDTNCTIHIAVNWQNLVPSTPLSASPTSSPSFTVNTNVSATSYCYCFVLAPSSDSNRHPF